MQSKLTLTVNAKVIESAKTYAKENKRSLSSIIEEYLKSLVSRKASNKVVLRKNISELKGSVMDPDSSISYKRMKQDALIKKHLR